MKRREFLATMGSACAVASAIPTIASPSPARRVVIAGAGLAGLSASYELAKSGYKVTVVEPRTRAGGRLFTLRDSFTEGRYVEAGGETAGSNYQRFYRYIAELGVATEEVEGEAPRLSLLMKGKLFKSDQPGPHPYGLTGEEATTNPPTLLTKHLRAMGEEVTSNPAKLAEYDKLSLAAALRGRGVSNEAIRLIGMALNYNDIETVSAAAPLWDLKRRGRGGGLIKRVRGGNSNLIAALSLATTRAGVTFLYGSVVKRVNHNKNGVRVSVSNLSGGQEHQNVGNDIGVRNKIAGLTALGPAEIGVPRISVTGLSPFGDEPNTIIRNNEDYQYDFTLSYNVGAHQIKTGGSMQRVNFAPSIQNIVRGNFGFGASAVSSGLGFADFLLGLPNSASSGAVAAADFRGDEYYFFAQDSWRIGNRLTLNYGARYEFQEPLVDKNLSVGNFDLNSRTIIIPYDGERLAPASAFRTATLTGGYLCTGVPCFQVKSAAALGITPGLIRADKNNWGPRFGFAWNALKGDRLIVRGGYGIYYNRKEQFAASTMAARPPFGFSASINPPTSAFIAGGARLQIENALSPSAVAAILLPVNPDMRTGYLQQWNLTTQTTFQKNWLLEVGYVGSKGSHLFSIDSRNYRPPSATALPNTTREFAPYIFGMAVWTDLGFSTYHSLQTRLVKRLSKGLQLSANYTWAHSIDNNSAGSSGSNDSDSGGSSNPFNRALEKGRSAFDARHRFVISSVYELPFGVGATGLRQKALKGWQLGTIASWRSANPFTVDSNFDFHNIGRASVNRPDLKGDPNAGPKTATQWFNTTAFVNPVRGVIGTAGRNILDGDTFAAVDFSVIKDTMIGEKLKVQFRAELFNVANHTNFGSPNRTYTPIATGYTAGVSANTNPDFGKMFGASDPRVAQFALKVIF